MPGAGLMATIAGPGHCHRPERSVVPACSGEPVLPVRPGLLDIIRQHINVSSPLVKGHKRLLVHATRPCDSPEISNRHCLPFPAPHTGLLLWKIVMSTRHAAIGLCVCLSLPHRAGNGRHPAELSLVYPKGKSSHRTSPPLPSLVSYLSTIGRLRRGRASTFPIGLGLTLFTACLPSLATARWMPHYSCISGPRLL